MRFALASWGSRGEIEPCAAVGRELLRRGHDVRIAVPPDFVKFADSAGLSAVSYGPELRGFMDAYRSFWTYFLRTPWKIKSLKKMWREISGPLDAWGEMSKTLVSLAEGADLLLTSNIGFEILAANVAERHDIPLVTLHWFPMRPNGQLLPFLPGSIGRAAMTLYDVLSRGGAAQKLEQAQRRELGLPKETGPWPQRVAKRAALEIQAYDEACFPGLAAEWAKWEGQRPFVGALTLELPTDADDEVGSWIA
ncbi:MAG TPA: glycosyltransferase, partial [Terriglobales bacterium]|nr:glycosyltransferase [Terriglobales bacterium]